MRMSDELSLYQHAKSYKTMIQFRLLIEMRLTRVESFEAELQLMLACPELRAILIPVCGCEMAKDA